MKAYPVTCRNCPESLLNNTTETHAATCGRCEMDNRIDAETYYNGGVPEWCPLPDYPDDKAKGK